MTSASDSDSELCRTCAGINFDWLLQYGRVTSLDLGKWRDIQNEDSCVFCRLVVHCVRATPSLPGPTTTIKLDTQLSWKLCVASSEYEGELRSDQYTNKYDLKSKRKNFLGLYDRRLIVRWQDCEQCGQIQFVVDDQKLQKYGPDSYQFLGRRVRSKRIDFRLLNTWLRLCEDYHGRSCCEPGAAAASRSSSKGPEIDVDTRNGRSGKTTSSTRETGTLRFIDVQRMCIVRESKSCTYAVMSYVWGESRMERQMPRTLRKHMEDERRDGQIPLPKRLPLTIRDSIEVARALGYRYLWNDALCIVQNDEEERARHVAKMDAIYSNADLTIVAGSGTNADWGLPGVSVRRTRSQVSAMVQGLRLAAILPSYNQLNDRHASATVLPINSRGWTFQEKIMSRRVLLFTEHQVYFRCKNAIWTEETIMETQNLSKSVKRRSSPFAWVADRRNTAGIRKELEKGIITYFRHTFGDPSEVRPDLGLFPNYATTIEAYTPRRFTDPADVLNAINGVLDTLQPSLGEFFEGLPSAHFHRSLLWKPPLYSTTQRRHTSGPSWSWAGWGFPRGCEWSRYDLETTTTTGHQELGKDPRFLGAELRLAGDAIAVISQHEGCRMVASTRKENPPHLSPSTRSFQKYRSLLCIKTAVLTFNIRPNSPQQKRAKQSIGERHEIHEIVDQAGCCVGELLAPSSVALPGNCRNRDFLIISWGKGLNSVKIRRDYQPRYDLSQFSVPIEDEMLDLPPIFQDKSKWMAANVILVGWDGDNVAQRVGLGKIIWTALVSKNLRTEWILVG